MAHSSGMDSRVRFNLPKGTVNFSTGEDCVLLPSKALVALCRELDTEIMIDFGRLLGSHAGLGVSRLLDDIQTADAKEAVAALGTELAMMGLGSLSLEFWGQAMVFVVTGSPILLGMDEGARVDPGDVFLGAVIEGALTRLGLPADIVAVARTGNTIRLLACNKEAKAHVLSWLGDGVHYGEILAKLNASAGAA